MRPILIAVALAAAGAAGLYATGHFPGVATAPSPAKAATVAPPPTVSVVAASTAPFVDTVLVTGSLVARREILVAPEVEGLRIKELAAEEGDSVQRGQVLARLERETLEAQLAQSTAALARSSAAIAQARSQIVQAQARLDEAQASFERAQPLRKSGALSESIFDQREAAARTSEAQLTAARDGLKLAEAERTQIEAQRREIVWRLERAEVRAPVDGLISRRTARVGAMGTAAVEPMFRMAEAGEIELEAEVPEAELAKLKVGQRARIAVAGTGEVTGEVRLVSPEVDRATRLGKVRVFLGSKPGLRIGAFGRGHVEVATSRGLAVPAASVMFGPDGPHTLVVAGETVESRRLSVGLVSADGIEVTSGLAEGDLVVARAGTFLRAGDRVRPVRVDGRKVSEAN